MEPNDLEESILLYPDLPLDERRKVEHSVKNHTEHLPLLDDVKAVAAFLDTAGALDLDPPADGILAYYAAMTYLPDRPVPEPLQASFSRIERTLNRHPALRARFDQYRARVADLDRSSDAVAQFEQLTGRRLSPVAGSLLGEPAPPRPAARRPLRLLLRYAAAAAVVLLGLYVLLALASRSTRSDFDRLAAIDPDLLDVGGYTAVVRGSTPVQPDTSADALFLSALGDIREAQTSFLGLFPGYREDRLPAAESLLERVVRDPEAGDFLRLEAYYFLGKIRLARRDVAGARDAFRTVVAGQGRMAPEAARILDALGA